MKRLRSWLKANLILSYYEHMKKRERSAINITCSKYLVLHKREADYRKTKRWDEKKIAEVNTDFDNKKKKEERVSLV